MSTMSEIEKELFKNFEELLCIEGASLVRIENPEANVDFAALLSVGTRKTKIIGEIKSSGKPSRIRAAIAQLQRYKARYPDYLPVLVVPFLGQRGRQICQAEDVGYIDLSGNCYLRWDGVHIEKVIEGKTFPESRESRRLFSDKASLALRTMLESPHKPWGARELERATGVSVSWVWEVLVGLVKAGYAARTNRGIYISRPLDLLEDWAESYYFSRRNDVYSFFCDAPTPQALISRIAAIDGAGERRYALTLHAGASLVAPFAKFHEVHMYVDPWEHHVETERFWMEALELEKVDRGGNLYLVWPYYKHGAFYGVREVNGVSVVSDIQLYIDLYNFPMRGREQAEHLMRKRLAYLTNTTFEQ